ncbi:MULTISPECIES: GNAT family N-acetyltransferase [Bartonella]|uniref:N-acetyltransferase YhbS n=1 Tax=Bartonella choladocola TaxID=2750995 RepID=A0A1U9MIJ0_9HYPH|nr:MULTISPECIES: N-acetyltransferase [Bartonella]AQT47767.1 putative N-acetyltransferase YhbS [Bartonella choladocola]
MENYSSALDLSQTPKVDNNNITLISEKTDHQEMIEELNREAFGPARFTRAAHLIREKGGHDLGLSFVAIFNHHLVGTIRMTPIVVGNVNGYLLGPIVISPKFKSLGVGSLLMRHTIETAKAKGVPFILLVGDEPYYRRFGFSKVPVTDMVMPLPVNPERLLALELVDRALETAKGLVLHKNQSKRQD